jgi:hypothetical protein
MTLANKEKRLRIFTHCCFSFFFIKLFILLNMAARQAQQGKTYQFKLVLLGKI